MQLSPNPRRSKVHKNKYAKFSKVDNSKETRAQPEREMRVRGLVEYPPVEEIDVNDPTSFGFIAIGTVLGTHGLKGEVKVISNFLHLPPDQLLWYRWVV